jgi:Glycosyltransferases involved in cell wall biogenesis
MSRDVSTSLDMTGQMDLTMNNSTIAAVIPAYQEQKHVGEVAQRALTQLEHVLVVDDGSTDATADRARAAGVDVVVHPQNRGKGESIKTGLRYWFDRGSEYVVLLDADGHICPKKFCRFVVRDRVRGRRKNLHRLANERHQNDAAATTDGEPLYEQQN